jgi:Domain of unknown function (DUF4872)/Butirosin biosynthesis protein H, N-terminal
MTPQKHLKQLVRARMATTGERYATARRHIIRETEDVAAPASRTGHFTGNVPATTALRTLLTAAGVHAPHSKQPFTEAMLFGIAGGVGIGMFSFLYEKANFASFYVAGRHDWADDVRYLTRAADRLGATTSVVEGVKPSSRAIAAALGHGQPCIIWLDAAALPYKAMPAMLTGMASHLVVLYAIDERANRARIGDLTDEAIDVLADVLASARGRIKKDKNRVMTVLAGKAVPNLSTLVHAGLDACRQGLLGANAIGGSRTNFSLDALRVWGDRLHGTRDKDSWERMFTPGARLWRALTSINEYIEHHGTGGGLCRPLFAEFLGEAADALGSGSLRALGEQYSGLGRAWSELANAAVPDDVPAMREAKELLAQRSELLHSDGPPATDAVRATWKRLDELATAAEQEFPLSASAVVNLRAELQRRVRAIHAAELAAHEALTAAVARWPETR